MPRIADVAQPEQQAERAKHIGRFGKQTAHRSHRTQVKASCHEMAKTEAWRDEPEPGDIDDTVGMELDYQIFLDNLDAPDLYDLDAQFDQPFYDDYDDLRFLFN